MLSHEQRVLVFEILKDKAARIRAPWFEPWTKPLPSSAADRIADALFAEPKVKR
jgi:hypothetical protein